MIDTSSREAERLLVGRDDTPLLGVSGHCLATLHLGDEVTKIGEYGAYAIVQCLHHQGYIETSLLAKPGELPEPDEGLPDDTSVQSRRLGSLLPWRRRKEPNSKVAV
jgi:hypothetical protein